MNQSYEAGVAPIKSEYLLHISRSSTTSSDLVPVPDDDSAEAGAHLTSTSHTPREGEGQETPQGGPDRRPSKFQKRKDAKDKKARGQNKSRHFSKSTDSLDLCWRVANGSGCPLPESECRFTHDIQSYLEAKGRDLRIPEMKDLMNREGEDGDSIEGVGGFESIDPHTKCPTYETFGECRFGFKCRFLGGHIRPASSSSSSALNDDNKEQEIPLELTSNPSQILHASVYAQERNHISADVLKALRQRKYPLSKTDAYLSSIGLESTSEAYAIWERKRDAKFSRRKGKKGGKGQGQGGVVVLEEMEQQEPENIDMDAEGDLEIDVDELNGTDVRDTEAAAASNSPVPSTIAAANTTLAESGDTNGAGDITPTATAPANANTNRYVNAMTVDEPTAPTQNEDAPAVLKSKEQAGNFGPDEDSDLKAKIKPEEKKRLRWDGMSYLAPLTTVGNLPFRRLCTYLGADITCGEMALTQPLISGTPHEWSLLRRHPSERIFGVQVAGSKPGIMVGVAEVVRREFGGRKGSFMESGIRAAGLDGVDFVDVNCGCPIDMVFKTGSGSALLDAPTKLSRILTGMSTILGDIPLTIKVRTGVKEGKNTIHRLLPRLVGGDKENDFISSEGGERMKPVGIGCISIHGRTRQQRYTKSADWDYIKQCVEAVRGREDEEDLSPIPIFGNGDIFSPSTACSLLASTGVSGIMVGRGALIKPWIFSELSTNGKSGCQPVLMPDSLSLLSTSTSGSTTLGSSFFSPPPFSITSRILETGDFDISSAERLSLIRLYTLFCLDHFGSDTSGVQKSRRYVCELLSFMHRYIPVGILERLPPRINDRPARWKGRDEMETLLGSTESRDWEKVAEMFLGKSPEEWKFVPKHKSNAYGAEEGQG